MRRYVGYALIAIALLTLVVWVVSQFIQPILPASLNSGLVLFFIALLGVIGVLAQLKDIVELFQSVFDKPTQTEKPQSVSKVISGTVQIVHGNVTNVTLNVTYLVQSSSFESIKAIKIQTEPSFRVGSLVPREAPPVPAHVIGRIAETATLKRILFQQSQSLGLISLSGMAGTGKTTLAAVLANDPDIERAFPDGTLWAFIERSRDFREILTRWIQVLSPSTNASELDGVDEWSLSAIFLHVIQHRRIFIVLDGVDRNNARYIQSFIKAIGPECRVLITSRIINLPGVETIVSLDLLPEHQAVLLIEKDIGRKLAPEEKDVAREVAFLLGYLPLALKIAVSQVRVTLCVTMCETTEADQLMSKVKESRYVSRLKFRIEFQ